MEYNGIVKGTFIKRPNRFIAHVEIGGRQVICHVKNTGRCKELLVPGATVYLEPAKTEGRKTPFSLIAVQKGDRLINMDSQIPNKVFGEAAKAILPITKLLPEKTFEDSRYDFYLEGKENTGFAEIKGVTLEIDGHALFPDAPTERGLKHIQGLTRLSLAGRLAYLIFVIQMSQVLDFYPNWSTQPAFLSALQEAQKAGVHIFAYDCKVTPSSIRLDESVPVKLEKFPLRFF